MKSMQT